MALGVTQLLALFLTCYQVALPSVDDNGAWIVQVLFASVATIGLAVVLVRLVRGFPVFSREDVMPTRELASTSVMDCRALLECDWCSGYVCWRWRGGCMNVGADNRLAVVVDDAGVAVYTHYELTLALIKLDLLLGLTACLTSGALLQSLYNAGCTVDDCVAVLNYTCA